MRKLVVAAMVLTLGLAACGKSTSDSSSGTTAKASTGNSTASAPVQLSGKVTDKGTKDATGKSAFTIEADDFYFNPTFIKTTPGQKITLTLKNEGKANHTFTSPDLSVDKELAPGSTVTVDITVPSADAAAFYCRFHQASGMQGAVFTKEGSSAGSGSGTTATTTAPSNGY
ncbi:MAG: hypothetical protein QOJ09_1168 [Actinomycetota bacterium]|jgi:plastocyanin|nr:hypothetical protein [Actinomycetota bacterium]